MLDRPQSPGAESSRVLFPDFAGGEGLARTSLAKAMARPCVRLLPFQGVLPVTNLA